jgi:predicted Zn-dependent protease
MMKNNILNLLAVATFLLLLAACKDGRGLNVFTVAQDKQLGAKLKAEIMANPAKYPILPFVGNEQAYNYMYAMRDLILKSPKIKYKNQFTWELHIIKDDKTLNAFAAPGGFMCVYTGLIKYLEHADHLAGVLGHEIAHADQRHSTQSMTKAYGLQAVLAVATGGHSNVLAEMAAGLTQLSFSRSHEKDADAHSVDYLCGSGYAADGAAGFFQKLVSSGSAGGTPAFLSTHPNPGNRVQAIKARAQKSGCSTQLNQNSGYAAFKARF